MSNYVVYLISGLGADERAFKFLKINCSNIININWVRPLQEEPLEDYCQRLTEQIDTTSGKEIILIGVSFGGIIAQEIAKKIDCSKVIIISSVKSTKELSLPLKFMKKGKFHRMISPKRLKQFNGFFARYFFSIKTKEEGKFLDEIIRDTDEYFMKWAIDRIVNWNSSSTLDNLVHIHGLEDRIFPVKNIKNAYYIKGGHFMIVNQANEISNLINEYLRKENVKIPSLLG